MYGIGCLKKKPDHHTSPITYHTSSFLRLLIAPVMIYIVDDTADYRFLVEQVFKRFLPQYPLRLFANGLELVQFIEQGSDSSLAALSEPDFVPNLSRPGLIVLDVDMPKLDGFQTLEHVKKNPLWQSIPVVMMSSRLEREFSEAALRGGAISYILKPMGLAELQNEMMQLCRQWLDGTLSN